MSSINSVRNLQILYFSKKNKEIKNLKNGEKKYVLILAFIHTTLVLYDCYCFCWCYLMLLL